MKIALIITLLLGLSFGIGYISNTPNCYENEIVIKGRCVAKDDRVQTVMERIEEIECPNYDSVMQEVLIYVMQLENEIKDTRQQQKVNVLLDRLEACGAEVSI